MHAYIRDDSNGKGGQTAKGTLTKVHLLKLFFYLAVRSTLHVSHRRDEEAQLVAVEAGEIDGEAKGREKQRGKKVRSVTFLPPSSKGVIFHTERFQSKKTKEEEET